MRRKMRALKGEMPGQKCPGISGVKMENDKTSYRAKKSIARILFL